MPRNEFRTLNLPIADELARRAGIRPRVRADECAAFAIGAQTPKLVFSPRTAVEASKTIALLAQEGANINIRGAGTKQWRPPAPRGLDAVLDTTRCSGIVEHAPADLTVTVRGGTLFAEVQAALRHHHQFLPMDPPFAAAATIGGILSARSTGALRQGYGGPRDQVLGMRVSLADGSVAFTGAKVVKSVSGYDIAKLFVGAFGTLGFVAEVTMKVAPLPPDQATVAAAFQKVDEAAVAANAIASSSLFPMASALLDGASAGSVRTLSSEPDRYVLAVRCGGSRATVKVTVDGVAAECRSAGASTIDLLDADRTAAAWSDIADLAGGSAYPTAHWLVCKLACLPSDVSDALAHAKRAGGEVRVMSHPVAGVLFIHVDVREGDPLTPIATLEHLCAERRWTLECLSAPPDFAQTLYQPVPAHAPLLLQRRVKAALDPMGTFDPGRLAGGV